MAIRNTVLKVISFKSAKNKGSKGVFCNIFKTISHKPVSTHTISKWIVKTIKLAHTDKAVKVKAHSTRSVGPSWAIFNGAHFRHLLGSKNLFSGKAGTNILLPK
jgi:hypothetical protein